jgi:hypothetical protein
LTTPIILGYSIQGSTPFSAFSRSNVFADYSNDECVGYP